MGVKVLRISRTLHLNDLSLVIMPSLIEIMVTLTVDSFEHLARVDMLRFAIKPVNLVSYGPNASIRPST